MAQTIGRNQNLNDTAIVTSYEINSLTATTIAVSNPSRTYFSVCLEHGVIDTDVYIRLYPAATDNDKKGEVLTRITAGNDILFRPSWTMPTDTTYTGEISAIAANGNINITVTEY